MKLEYDGPLSNFAFNCNLRLYNQDASGSVDVSELKPLLVEVGSELASFSQGGVVQVDPGLTPGWTGVDPGLTPF